MMYAFLFALACSGGGGGDSEASTSGKDSTPEDSSPPIDENVAPKVLSVALLDCAEQQSAGEVWQVTISVDDPQGAATVQTGTEEIFEDTALLGSYTMACGSGACTGGFRAVYDNIGCDLNGTIKIHFTVTDTEGHSSETFVYDTAHP